MLSDEQAPDVETPDEVDEQPQVNWEQRYNDLRPEFDRRAQEASQYRQLVEGLSSDDHDTRLQAAEALGIEFVDTDDNEPDLYEDPTDARLAAIEQRFAQQEAQENAAKIAAEEQSRVDQAAEIVNQQLDALGLDNDTAELVFAKSLTLPKTPDGLPDVEAAHAAIAAYQTAQMKQWAQSKKGSFVSPVGTSGTQSPDLDDPEQRVAWMQARLAAMDD